MRAPRGIEAASRWLSLRAPRWWTIPIAVTGSIAVRRGAVTSVVDEARRRTDLPAHLRLQMVQWAAAVVGDGPLPPRFRPGQQISDPAARAAAADALRARLDSAPSPRVTEQLVAVDVEIGRVELLELVRNDVSSALATRSTRPKRGSGVDPEALKPIVDKVMSRLERAGITPFLMSGTLLGFMREGTFLHHDHDVDLGLLPEVQLSTVEKALRGSGLELETLVPGEWLVAIHDTGLHIDFFRHDLRDGLFWHQTRIHQWWNTPFGLSELDVGDRTWWIPDDPQRYLDENYGDWSEPVAFYNISFDTPNRCYVDGTDAIRELYAACSRAIAAGDRWTVESAARELRDTFGIDVTENLAPSPLLSSDDLRGGLST